MKHFLLSLFIFTSIFSYAQDWFPFPLGQKSYFEHTNDLTINTFLFDSIYVKSDTSIYYSNYVSDNISNCQTELAQYQGWQYISFNNYTQPDSIISVNDTLFFHYTSEYDNSMISCIFLPYIQPGEFWTTDIPDFLNTHSTEVTFQCDSIIVDTIFNGLMDTLKYFSAYGYDNYPCIKVILSQHYGFVRYIPMNVISAYYLPLIGINSDSTNSGYSPPQLQDYFHLQTTDKLIWKYYEDNFSIIYPDTTYYYQDSITNVISSADSVIYSIFRTYQNGTTQNTHYRYDKKNLKGLFGNTNSFFTGNNLYSNYLCNYYIQKVIESSPIYLTNNITSRDFVYSGLRVDTSNCYFSSTPDIAEDVTFNTKYGLTRKYQFVFETDSYWTIEGSTINGVEEGILWENLLTSTNEITPPYFDISIYPNPVSKNGNISFKGENITSTEIYNIQGQKIATHSITNNQLTIDLPKGVYIMKTINGFGKNSILKLLVN